MKAYTWNTAPKHLQDEVLKYLRDPSKAKGGPFIIQIRRASVTNAHREVFDRLSSCHSHSQIINYNSEWTIFVWYDKVVPGL